MTLSKRSVFILDQLMNTPSYLTADELQKKLQVSKRTVYYDVRQINNWLEDHQLDTINQQYGKGIYLEDKIKQKLPHYLNSIKGWYYHLSKDERLACIAVLMLNNQSYYAKDFAKKLWVSRSTITHDIAELRQALSSLNLDITFIRNTGYTLVGNEENKRQVFVQYFAKLFSQQNWDHIPLRLMDILNEPSPEVKNDDHFEIQMFPVLKQWVSEAEKIIHVSYTDEMHDNLAIKSIVICKRLKSGEHITLNQQQKEALIQTQEYQAAEYIADRLNRYLNIEWPEDDICFLTMNLLGAKVDSSTLSEETHQELGQLKQVIQLMVTEFQNRACVIFEERKCLEKQLFIHLKPTYYRLKYGVFVENLLTMEIKKTYWEIFEITKKVVHHFEKLLQQPLRDDETAYIAMHFGGWLRKHDTQIAPKKKGIVVCENGVGTSNILKAQIEGLVSTIEIVNTVSLKHYQRCDFSNIDYIFSTKPIPDDPKVFQVSPILGHAEKERLLKQMQHESGQHADASVETEELLSIIQKHTEINHLEALKLDLDQFLNNNNAKVRESRKPMLNEVLSEDHILPNRSVESWQEAIKVAAQPLQEQGYIEETYINAMIQGVKDNGPYIVIAPKIAVPHARPESGVQRLGMSLLTIKDGIYFSDQEDHFVQMVIVLAAVDNDTHLKALSQLTELISNQDSVDEMIQATDPKTIMNLVNQVSI
ncbi:BglG family transcription antiterminator [Tuberibacillus sp. Marseille-P3662]|uniref:BglG family transcription antiterminator n=1 Tax=Tuberibacillus sp. Marseille-P3662 TaxID=1965358 RepID=UPI0015943357|nr:BglG family transcription antiterminator [Tuberibacillus sp. Marseille-P3662]